MEKKITARFLTFVGKPLHILFWSTALLYLLLSPSFNFHFLVQEGKPLEVCKQEPTNTGGIRYNIEDLKYWSKNLSVYSEGETYALWGWAFLDIGQKIALTDFDRYVVLTDNQGCSYLFSTQIYPRPGANDFFKELVQELELDLTSSGFYAVMVKNALPPGSYNIGILFEHKQNGSAYYITTNENIVRTPNHLNLEPQVGN